MYLITPVSDWSRGSSTCTVVLSILLTDGVEGPCRNAAVRGIIAMINLNIQYMLYVVGYCM